MGAVGHAVGDARRQEALECAEHGDGDGGAGERAGPGEGRQRRGRQGRREPADLRHVEIGGHGDERGEGDPQQRRGEGPVQPRGDDHGRHDEQRDTEGHRTPVVDGVAQGLEGGDQHVLGIRSGHAERDGHLLEEDDHGDAEGEPLDHRPGHVGERAPDPRQGGGHEEQTGEDRHHQDAVDPVAGDDGDQHDGHGAGGAADLHAGAAEDPRDEPGHDGGDEAGIGAQPGADPERQGQRQRHDADGDARHEVLAPGAPDTGVVAARREEAGDPGHRRGDGGRGHDRAPDSRPSSSPLVSARELTSTRLAAARSSASAGSRRA